jgi:hypothetical protein
MSAIWFAEYTSVPAVRPQNMSATRANFVAAKAKAAAFLRRLSVELLTN